MGSIGANLCNIETSQVKVAAKGESTKTLTKASGFLVFISILYILASYKSGTEYSETIMPCESLPKILVFGQVR